VAYNTNLFSRVNHVGDRIVPGPLTCLRLNPEFATRSITMAAVQDPPIAELYRMALAVPADIFLERTILLLSHVRENK
jgi:hypothetical protein